MLKACLTTAKEWGYVKETPKLRTPSESSKKRHFWEPDRIRYELDRMLEAEKDSLLHLAVHLAFMCSLRAGETAGIHVDDLNNQMKRPTVWIRKEIQRVSDESLEQLPKASVYRVFPKQRSDSKSSLILKDLKTEKSERVQFLSFPLWKEIQMRLEQIEKNKAYFGSSYNDYGLLLCHPNGNPLEQRILDRWFKKWQHQMHIPEDDLLDFQGLRKSGQMHKIRISQFNYQLVGAIGGHSPEVLMHNYDEALESEKLQLMDLLEANWYNKPADSDLSTCCSPVDTQAISKMLINNPELLQQVMQAVLASAGNAQKNSDSRN